MKSLRTGRDVRTFLHQFTEHIFLESSPVFRSEETALVSTSTVSLDFVQYGLSFQKPHVAAHLSSRF